MTLEPGQSVAIVAIGRNEGARLKSCLRSVCDGVRTVVYVDSGSDDGSADYAREMGCHVVELDPHRPFSAARARNEGFAALMRVDPDVPFIQFLDGDCDLVGTWLNEGIEALNERPEIGVACGHVREIYPDASLYNKLCNMEWQKTPGIIRTSGGRFLIRREVFSAVGGFRADVIAAEDDEFCVRVRRLGWKILQVDAEMALHDADLSHLTEWWRRARRTGHAYAHVASLHGKSDEQYFVRDCRRILLWALILPIMAAILAPFTYGWSIIFLLLSYALEAIRIYHRGRTRGWPAIDSFQYAVFAVLAKFPALEGFIAYHWRQYRGQALTVMEYRRSSSGT